MHSLEALKRWRENYYASKVLAAAAKPLHGASRGLSREIEYKIRKNGATIRLPNGRDLRLARDSGVSLASNLYWKGLDGYEPQTSRTLRFFFPRVSSFVDVGANYGFYSLLAALWNPGLRIVAFEPVPDIHQGLLRNIRLNELERQVIAVPAALSDASGRSHMYLPNSTVQDVESTGTLVEDSWQSKKNSLTVPIETIKFDDFEEQHPMKVELVKIDVEDYEANVLQGMRSVIQRDRPFLVCEILPRAHHNERTRSVIEELGYTAYWITPAGCIKVSRFDFDRTISEDFLLSPFATNAEVVTDLEMLWEQRARAIAA